MWRKGKCESGKAVFSQCCKWIIAHKGDIKKHPSICPETGKDYDGVLHVNLPDEFKDKTVRL